MRIRRFLLLATLSAPVLLAASRPVTRPAAAPPPWCLPTSDARAMRIMGHLTDLTSSDSDVADIRAALDSLPVVPRSEIQMLADEALCQRASQALDSAYFPQPLHSAVYLAQYGNRYFATAPGYQRGEWRYLVNLDSTFRVLHAFAW